MSTEPNNDSKPSKWSDGDTSKFGRAKAGKYHKSIKAQSDRHQSHQRKYEQSHQQERLERWYSRITTPKPDKPRSTNVARKFTTVPLPGPKMAQHAELLEAVRKAKKAQGDERSAARLAKYKRDTHWVARSAYEYMNMHAH